MTKRWAAACLLAAASCGADPALPPAVGELPPGFLWGTAIAPYQVEGGLHADDWYAWETACSICSGDSADDGPDFWNRWADDLDAAVAMKNNAVTSQYLPGRKTIGGSTRVSSDCTSASAESDGVSEYSLVIRRTAAPTDASATAAARPAMMACNCTGGNNVLNFA
jgi:hypothetical protein